MSSPLRNYYLDALNITRWKVRKSVADSSIKTPIKSLAQPQQKSTNMESMVVWDRYLAEPQLIFLAETNEDQHQELLEAIIRACAKERHYASGKLRTNLQNLDALPILNCQAILIFGVEQAQRLNLKYLQKGIYELSSIKVYVTYTLQELATYPEYKRELWQTWQNLMQS